MKICYDFRNMLRRTNSRAPIMAQQEEHFSDSDQDSRSIILADALTFLDLPWKPVICCHILPYLSIPELFHLRCVSIDCKDLVQTFFNLQMSLNTSSLGDSVTPTAFQIMTQETYCLKTLSLRGAKSWLSNQLLQPVVVNNPRLEKVDLTGCLGLSGSCLYSIGVNCTNLKHLALRNCVWISSENFVSFLCNGQDLEYLDISGCWNLDDEIVLQLVQVFKSLKTLLLSNLYGLTDRAIGAIAHSCPKLIHLSVQGCWRVTDASVNLLAQYCPNLRGLQISECRNITENSLAALREKKVRVDRPAPPSAHLQRLEYMHHLQRINLVL